MLLLLPVHVWYEMPRILIMEDYFANVWERETAGTADRSARIAQLLTLQQTWGWGMSN